PPGSAPPRNGPVLCASPRLAPCPGLAPVTARVGTLTRKHPQETDPMSRTTMIWQALRNGVLRRRSKFAAALRGRPARFGVENLEARDLPSFTGGNLVILQAGDGNAYTNT